MLRTGNEDYKELLGDYADSVQKLLNEIDEKLAGLDKVNETPRTKYYNVEKRLKNWFANNGGI